MQWFEYFTCVKYVLLKLQLLAIPNFQFGDKENYWLKIFWEESLLSQESRSSFQAFQTISPAILHEISHPLAVNSVFSKWWNEIRINKGFGNLLPYLSIQYYYPERDLMELFDYIHSFSPNIIIKIRLNLPLILVIINILLWYWRQTIS